MTLNGAIALIFCVILPNLIDSGAHCVKVADKAITVDNSRLGLLCVVVNACRGTARRPRYKYSITVTPRWKFDSRFINSRFNAQYLPSYRLICLNEVGALFGVLKYVCDIVVKKVHVRYLIS